MAPTTTTTMAPISYIEIAPSESTIEAGDSQEYTAAAFDEGDNFLGFVDADYVAYPFFGEGGGEIFGGGTGPLAAALGEVAGEPCDGNECGPTDAGTYEIVGTYEGHEDSAFLDVVPGPADEIELYPEIDELPYCPSETFFGYIVDDFGNVVDTDQTVTFADIDGGAEANILYGEGGPSVPADSGYFELEVIGNMEGPVQLEVTGEDEGLSSNIIEFDVVDAECVFVAGAVPLRPPDGGPGLGIVLLAIAGLAAVGWSSLRRNRLAT
jgi:hypothetical protein